MRMKTGIIAVAICALLSGCQDAPPQSATPQLTLAQIQPINLNVGKIDISSKYVPPMRDPNVDHLFQQTPEQVTEALIQKQLVAAGNDQTLRAIITDASVVKQTMTKDSGITGLFAPQPAEKYHARVAVRFELVNNDAPDVVLAHAEVSTEREKTLYEDASIADRDAAFLALDEAIVNDLSNGFNTTVRNSFGQR